MDQSNFLQLVEGNASPSKDEKDQQQAKAQLFKVHTPVPVKLSNPAVLSPYQLDRINKKEQEVPNPETHPYACKFCDKMFKVRSALGARRSQGIG